MPREVVLKVLEAKLKKQEEVIKECIRLLSVDGSNTKALVKEKLEGLLK